jgi:hypothetical protein
MTKRSSKKSAAVRRCIWAKRPIGLDPAMDAPFWRGDTAERVMKKRLREYRRQAAAKAARRKAAALRRKRGPSAR